MREGAFPLVYRQTALNDLEKFGNVGGRKSEPVNRPTYYSKTEGIRPDYGNRKG